MFLPETGGVESRKSNFSRRVMVPIKLALLEAGCPFKRAI